MSDVVFKITVPSDDDGFITLQCPFCGDRFKLTVEGFEREDIIELFCPYCGLQHENNRFFTDEVIEQAEVVARNYANSIINNWLKDMEKSFKSNKHMTFKAGKHLEMEREKLLFEREELETTNLVCCQLAVKTRPLNKEIDIYCPCCGVR